MVDYIVVPSITFVFCAASLFLLFRDIREKWPEEERAKGRKTAAVYSAVMIAVTAGAAALLLTVYKENSMWSKAKLVLLMSSVWPLPLIDFKTMRIPNPFIILGLAGRVITVPFELLFGDGYVGQTLLSEVIAAAALIVAALLCMLVIKNSIGFGDIKLFVLMGLTMGLSGIWSAIFVALVVSFIIALIALITKRKTRKDTIPFGPALVFGIFLSVCLTGL